MMTAYIPSSATPSSSFSSSNADRHHESKEADPNTVIGDDISLPRTRSASRKISEGLARALSLSQKHEQHTKGGTAVAGTGGAGADAIDDDGDACANKSGEQESTPSKRSRK